MSATPGPWKVDDLFSSVVTVYEPKVTRVSGYGCGNNFVADLNDGEYHSYWDPAEQEANAHLIAAAPEMYEALNWLTHIEHGIGKSGGKLEPGEREAAIDSAKKALAKARGEKTAPAGNRG